MVKQVRGAIQHNTISALDLLCWHVEKLAMFKSEVKWFEKKES